MEIDINKVMNLIYNEVNTKDYQRNKEEDNIYNNIESFLAYNSNDKNRIMKLLMKELNDLIGLYNVKNEINKLFCYLSFVKKINNQNINTNLNLNMIFRGNPGTGKTTVARIVSKILYYMGYLENIKFIETTPSDFMAGYVGQTAPKTKKILDEYRGGLIFIDEAYSFANSKDAEFAKDALTEIIKEMEKKKTVFIFAGYDENMDKFLSLNPGIKSRVGYDIKFYDYNEGELMEIFKNKILSNGFNIDDDALIEVEKVIKTKMQIPNFGNGRMIDNLYDEIILNHSLINYNEQDINKLLRITKDSIKSS